MSIASEIENLNTNLQAAKNAVTAKGGTVGDTGLAGLAIEIASIPSGGTDPGGTKAVRFIDYDGTIVTQMTVGEAAELTSLPGLPIHTGLTAIGWTHTLAEVTSTTSPLDVGAIYQNSANARQSLFEMYPTEGQEITLNFGQSVSEGVVIDWGDGSATETVSGEGNVSVTHTYSSVGTSEVPFSLTLTPSEGTTLTLGHGGTSTTLFGGGLFYAVQRAILGEVTIARYAFRNCYSLHSVIIPNSVTSFSNGAFSTCYSLSSVVIPNSVTSIDTNAFSTCPSLSSVVIPNSVTSIGSGAFTGCYSLSSVVIPNSVTSIGSNAFSTCSSISSVVIPNSVTSIGSNAFTACYSLSSVVYEDRASMPSASNVYFFTSYGPKTIDCSSFTQVPTVASGFFSNMPAYVRILVPASLETGWKAAANWSTYADQIVGV